MVKAKLEEMGVVDVRSAVLYAHSWGVGVPDYIGIISDALIFNPWDREILRDGQFIFHPEYSEALRHQALLPDESMLIEAEHFSLAKLKP